MKFNIGAETKLRQQEKRYFMLLYSSKVASHRLEYMNLLWKQQRKLSSNWLARCLSFIPIGRRNLSASSVRRRDDTVRDPFVFNPTSKLQLPQPAYLPFPYLLLVFLLSVEQGKWNQLRSQQKKAWASFKFGTPFITDRVKKRVKPKIKCTLFGTIFPPVKNNMYKYCTLHAY